MAQGIVAKVMMDKEPIFPQYFAAWHKDKDVLKASTSGGAFTAFAEPILAQGGIVVGAAYDHDLNVRHEIVETLEGLKRLRGVKYVHGEIGKAVFDGISLALESGRRVLFTGLPCQAAAIRKRFGSNEKLLIVDLICFGAPPMMVWRKYVDMLEKRRGVKLRYIDPRDKQDGWGVKTYYRYEWRDGEIERKLSLFDPYAQVFYRAIAFGEGCFHCPFKGLNSRADITIGDCNGYQAMSFDYNVVRRGISCVIVRTENGKKAFDCASLEKKRVAQELMVQGNGPILNTAKKPLEWERFAIDVRTLPFSDVIRKYKLQITPWRHFLSVQRGRISWVLRKIYTYFHRRGNNT